MRPGDNTTFALKSVVVDPAYVDSRLKDLAQSEDLARYVL